MYAIRSYYVSDWYEAGFPNPGWEYGFIHTDDHGETITFFDTTNRFISNMAGDRSQGLIYRLAGYYDVNTQRSYDNGANWDTTVYNLNISYTLFFEGNQAGELYLFNDYDHNLYQSIDSGASFQLIRITSYNVCYTKLLRPKQPSERNLSNSEAPC